MRSMEKCESCEKEVEKVANIDGKSLCGSCTRESLANVPKYWEKIGDVFTHKELIDSYFEPPEWIIEKILGKGHLGVLTGFSGHGKSWVALALAMSASSGKTFLGKYEIEQMPVLYIENENGTYELRRRVEYLGNGERLENLYFAPYPSMDLLESTEWLETQIKEKGIQLVILDSFAGLHAGKENEAEQMRKVLTKLKKIALDYRVTFVLLLHPNKGNNFKGNNKSFPPDYLDRIRGSSEFRNVADDIIGIHMPNPDDREFFFEPVKCRTGGLQPGEIFGMVFDDEQKTLGFEFVGKKKDYKLGAEKCLNDIVIWATNEAPDGKFKTKEAIDAMGNKWGKSMVNDALKIVREEKCEQIRCLKHGKYQLTDVVHKVQKLHMDNLDNSPQEELNQKQRVGVGVSRDTNSSVFCSSNPKVHKVHKYVIADNFLNNQTFDPGTLAIALKLTENEVLDSLQKLSKDGIVHEVFPGMWRRGKNG